MIQPAGRSIQDGWIDCTRIVTPGMTVWPGDPPVELRLVSSIRSGESCNVSQISMSAHTGTHMDAPFHYLADGAGIDAAPLDVLVGHAHVIAIDDPICVRPGHLESLKPGAEAAVFFKTSRGSDQEANTDHSGFDENFKYISLEAAQVLATRGIRLVGIDTVSVGGFYDRMIDTHLALLQAGCWIVENLNLTDIEPGIWEYLCLPTRLSGCDAAPARVLLRPDLALNLR